MKCPRCQAENNAGARFCEDCGARLEAACPSCGTAVTPGKKFCRSCGAALTTEPAGRFASPESYTPKHLAEKILTSKSALEGERKQVTVLFADLKGSMELLADRDPEEARRILDPVLERMMEAVHRYEGTVNQVMGDGIMALFGAPLAQEDHAIRACYAALRLQKTVRLYAEEVRRTEGIPIQIRVGLNSGEVVVRSIGSDLRMDYTAVGQTTHLAARMEQMATPGTILLTRETLALAEGFVQVASLGPMGVKGLPSPIEVFELTSASHVRSRLQAAAARGLTRFVGRDAEIELLSQALERAGGGRGQVVAVVGEPGVGKSRLVLEFTHSHRTRDWLVLEAASVSYGKPTTYFPVIELLKSYFQIEPRDDARKIREKLTGKLLSLDRGLEPTLPVLLSLLDIPVDDPEWARLDPPQRRRQTLDSLKRLLLRESQVQPVLLVFEDLHWIDSETQALLDTLVGSVPTARLLLLISYRPEYTHAWGSKTYYQQLRLDVLPAATADELLEALVGRDASLSALKALLVERTEGNPFFLEEAVRALAETKMLVGERGEYRLAGPVRSLQLPTTAQAILAARIDRLAPEDKRLLQAAAVVGKDVPFVLLQAIADETEEQLHAGLARLQAAEFLYEAQLFPEVEYTFKHALTHEVAYRSLLQSRRCTLHNRIVDAIETLYAHRVTEFVEQLADHAFRGEAWEKAVSCLREATRRAMARAAYREAVAFGEQALAALGHLPQTPHIVGQAIDIRFQIRVPLMALADIRRLHEHLSLAETLASRLEDHRRLVKIIAYKTHYFWLVGQYEQALETGVKALALATSLGDSRVEAEAILNLGATYYYIGDYRKAIAVLHRISTPSMTDADNDQRLVRPRVTSRGFLAISAMVIGDFSLAITMAEEALRLAETSQDFFALIHGLFYIGGVHTTQGAFDLAIPKLERALRIADGREMPGQSYIVASFLGHAYAHAGHLETALPILDRAVREASELGSAANSYPPLAPYIAAGYLLVGRRDLASDTARLGLQLSRERKERGSQADNLRVLGEIASGSDDPERKRAEDHYCSALALGTELDMRPLVAHCHLGLGKLYRRTGMEDQAREHLTTATTMYREMDMRFWLEQAETKMRELA